ncbi:MAG: hypothetical protein ACFFE4_19605 [Candidatus Thorarchaeota archaeon]
MKPLHDAELNIVKHLIANNTKAVAMQYLLDIREDLPNQFAFYIILGIMFENYKRNTHPPNLIAESKNLKS